MRPAEEAHQLLRRAVGTEDLGEERAREDGDQSDVDPHRARQPPHRDEGDEHEPAPEGDELQVIHQPRDGEAQDEHRHFEHDAEAELARNGRLVIRPSGTEPLIRVMAEGDDRAQIERIVNELIGTISNVRTAA